MLCHPASVACERGRRGWYATWGAGENLTEVERRLEVLSRLGTVIEAHVRLRTTAGSGARELAGIELASGFVPLLNQATPELLRESLDLTFEGRDALALDALAFVERQTAGLRLVNQLAEQAQQAGVSSERTLAAVIVELAQSPGPRGPEAPERARMARFSRWSFEWSQALHAGRGRDRNAALDYLNGEALALLDLLERTPRDDSR